MKVVAVIGTSKAGKTSTIEFLVSSLTKMGFKVGTVKHVHEPGFTIDTGGKDTWRHAQAGAKIVAIVASDEIALIRKRRVSRIDLDEVIGLFKEEGLDLLLLEGFHALISNRNDVIKIIAAKDLADMERTIENTVPPILAITGPVARNKPDMPSLMIPIIDIYVEGADLVHLVAGQLKE